MIPCWLCGNPVIGQFLVERDGHLVCRDLAACTDRVMRPPPPLYEEFVTDEKVAEMMRRTFIPPGLQTAGRVLTAVTHSLNLNRPEWRGAEVQVARDEMRAGWKVRVTR